MARAGLHWLLGICGAVLACEVCFRILPVSTSTETGRYVDPLIVTYPPFHQWTTATGWDLRNVQRHRANNFGFVAHRDFKHDAQAVALIGDSFVESSMLAAHDRPDAQLEQSLGGRPVFALGGPGSALLDYAERVRFAVERFGVRDVVILMERGDVRQSLCGSGNIHGPCLDPQTLAPRNESQPPPGIVKRSLRHSAFAQYLVSQLKLRPERLWHQALAQSRPVIPETPSGDLRASSAASASGEPKREVDAVSNAFFERVCGLIRGHLVIVLDTDREALYRGSSTADPDRDRFIALARANGALVIDTEPLFRAHLAHSPLKLDVGPYDGHFNSLGVHIVMGAAADALLSSPVPDQPHCRRSSKG